VCSGRSTFTRSADVHNDGGGPDSPLQGASDAHVVTVRVGRLGHDAEAPFRFRLGDRVAWKRYDDGTDCDAHGIIVDGTCLYMPESGTRQPPIYVVACKNGEKFTAAEMTLVLVRFPISEAPR
jgi:hypothetical protein